MTDATGVGSNATGVACVLVPHFAAAAHERCEPALREQPLAVMTGTAPARRVLEANALARAAGVLPGLSETEARTRAHALVVRDGSDERIAAARHAVLEAALGVSPRVEDAAAGVVFVDLAGLDRLFGDEEAIARRLVRAARRVGLDAVVGIASSRTVARVAARLVDPSSTLASPRSSPAGSGEDARLGRRESATSSGSHSAPRLGSPDAGKTLALPRSSPAAPPPRLGSHYHIISAGGEGAALAGVELSVLDLPRDVDATLGAWGVRTLGELAGLPRRAIAMRLGRAGLRAQDLAAGLDLEPFRPWTPPAFWQEAQGVDWEIDSWERLAPVLEVVLDRLTVRLDAAHLCADALHVQLGLATGGHEERTVTFASPLRERRAMQALVGLEIEARPLQAPVVHVAICAHAVRTEAAQARLGQRPSPTLRDLAETLARLATLVGRENVGSPVLLDSHRPDAFVLAPFAPAPDDEAGADEPRAPFRSSGSRADADIDTERLAFRRVRPPRPIDVETADDMPVSVCFRDALGGVSAPARVVARAGPWRASDEWWDAHGWAREEWDVELADGMVWRIARDRVTGAWAMDGAYD